MALIDAEPTEQPTPEITQVATTALIASQSPRWRYLRAAGLPDGVFAARLGHDENVMRTVYGVPQAAEQAAAVMARLLG